MSGDSRRVTIVVGDEAGASIASLAETGAVWAIRTPDIEAAAADVRRAGRDVTIFNRAPDSEALLLDIIDEVELHHGPASYPDTPVAVIEVVGTSVSHPVVDQLQAMGFSQINETPAGFVAERAVASDAR